MSQLFGTKIDSLLNTGRILNLIQYSNFCAPLGGYLAEFGIYQGGSLEILARFNPGVNILAVDSFEGVPQETEHDYHRLGDFGGVDYHAIGGYFKLAYPTVRIFKGFIPKVFDVMDEHTRFSFVHVDLDMYESIKHSLDFIMPRLLDGGMILLDDYKVRTTPGCEKAIEDFFEAHEIKCQYRRELKLWDTDNAPSHKQFLIVK